MSFETVSKNLTAMGFTVKQFATGAEAADYVDSVVTNTTVGIGGSGTVNALGLYERLLTHNESVRWHWKEPDAREEARSAAADAEAYLTSVNALAETGEMVSIDGSGNRIASTLYGPKRLFILIGRNKLVPTFEDAIWRARNIAAPKRAQQMNSPTPCAVKGDRCYNCKSPGRVCRGMATLWCPMVGMETEILLIDEDLGL